MSGEDTPTPPARAASGINTRRMPAAALIVLGLAAGPVVALGFTRFAYALLLPAMRSDLGWSFLRRLVGQTVRRTVDLGGLRDRFSPRIPDPGVGGWPAGWIVMGILALVAIWPTIVATGSKSDMLDISY